MDQSLPMHSSRGEGGSERERGEGEGEGEGEEEMAALANTRAASGALSLSKRSMTAS